MFKKLFDRSSSMQAKLDQLLSNSNATSTFKEAVRCYVAGKQSPLIQHPSGVPPIKVVRVLMKLLEEFGDERITDVQIQGMSSCSAFHGTLIFGPNHSEVRFNWDCGWKAEQEGLTTWYGAPDQTKAAQTFGYQCFETFERIDSNLAR